MSEKNMLLRTISAIGFYLYELQLFLNTHPNNAEAIALFTQYRQKYLTAVADFERKYGPLSAVNGVSDSKWKWIRGPWPWEYSANAEV